MWGRGEFAEEGGRARGDERWSWRRGGGMAELDGGDGGTSVRRRRVAAA